MRCLCPKTPCKRGCAALQVYALAALAALPPRPEAPVTAAQAALVGAAPALPTHPEVAASPYHIYAVRDTPSNTTVNAPLCSTPLYSAP